MSQTPRFGEGKANIQRICCRQRGYSDFLVYIMEISDTRDFRFSFNRQQVRSFMNDGAATTEIGTSPEIPPQTESNEDSTPIKKQRGGKRAGAGRKPDLVRRMISRLTPATAREVLSTVDAEKVIKEIFAKGSLTLKQRTLADLWDRAWGRPAQAVSVSGAVLHAHWTPGKYSHLTDEEFAKLAELSAKALGQPTLNTAQDAPGNQIESKPASRSGR